MEDDNHQDNLDSIFMIKRRSFVGNILFTSDFLDGV